MLYPTAVTIFTLLAVHFLPFWPLYRSARGGDVMRFAAVGEIVHVIYPRAVPVMIAPETGWLGGKGRSARRRPALLVHLLMASPAAPEAAARLLSLPAATHPVAAWSACVHITALELSPKPSSLAIFHLVFPFLGLVFCVCGHLLIATRRSTSSCCASPRVLRIGVAGAGNRRGLAHCAGFWSSFWQADLSIFCAILYCISSFILYSIPVLSFLLPLCLFLYLFLHPIRTPLDVLTSNLQLDRCSTIVHHAVRCIPGSVRIIGPYHERYGMSLRTATISPPAAPTRWELECGYRDPASTAILCAARIHCAEETLDESAEPRHTHTRAAWCLEDRRCATSGENGGAERAHTRDWSARRGYEVRELEHGCQRDVEVHPRSRSASSTRTRLPSPDSTRARLPTGLR
ncbi:hypothetical protein B0H13DRAFT_2680356 [Mycena leptocephala]|nr:hypothetical protein B0H13DRAFT_2680356 [Mycena leptocephala]